MLAQSTTLLPILLIAAILVAVAVAILSALTLARHRKMLAQVRNNELRLRAIMTTAVDGVITINEKGIVLDYNPSAEHIFGWKAEEIIGHNIKMLMKEPLHSQHDGYLEAYLRTGEAKIIGRGREVVGMHKDGSPVPIRLAIGHARLPGQNLFVGFMSDISQRLKMERALRENERQYRSLITNIPGIAFRCRPDAKRSAIFVSDAIEALTGYATTDFTREQHRHALNDLIHPEDLATTEQAINNAIHNKSNSVVLEYRIVHRNGSIRWMWEQSSPILSDSGNIVMLDGVIFDITERRKMEEALRKAKESAEQAAAAKSAFLASMSHEIRTPMNAIIGFTDILLTSELTPQQRRHLDIVRDSSTSLLHLLNDILDSAKLERGAVELETLDFDLLCLLEQIDDSLGTQARTKGLTFRLHLDAALTHYYKGDASRIRQILNNLVGNAIKFTEHGSVTLHVKPTPEGICFAIEDTGIGIPANRSHRIFTPFAQADASMNRRFGGTGLGTSISKELVELMGGRIWMASTPDKGSTFSFSLPLQTGSAVHGTKSTPAWLQPQHILVVDDVAQNVELLATVLRRAGHTVSAVTDGENAVQSAASTAFDLILMDLHMPDIDGLEATRRIRAEEQQQNRPRTPIIALTASVFQEDRDAATAAGMDGFTVKPIDLSALFSEMARVLHLPITTLPSSPPVSATAPVSSRVFSPISSLDLPKALDLWGDLPTYTSALQRFLDTNSTLAQTLLQHIENNETDAAWQLAHRCKGAAANLSVRHLAQALGELERVLRADQTESAAIRIAEIDRLMHELVRETASLTPPPSEADANTEINLETPATLRFSTAEITQSLSKLRNTLQRGALDESILATLHVAFTGHAQQAEFSSVEKDIASFELLDASKKIDALLKKIDENHEEP